MSLGPLTTSFTPPPDCVASSALYWVNTADTFYWLHGRPFQTSCFPENYSPFQNQYYAPGICPAGYTRACESESTSGALATVTRATCCPQGNYVCAGTSSSYSYPWGPTLGCMSVYRVDTETSFTTVDGTLHGGETAGEPKSLFAPGTILAYGVVIQNGAATSTGQDSGSAQDTVQTGGSKLPSSTGSSATDTPAAAETQSNSDGGGSGGLSRGAAAGIGIATAFGILAIGGAVLWLFWSRRRKQKQPEAVERARAEASLSPGTWSEITTPQPYQRAAVQVNWQPTELAHDREPGELGPGMRTPVEMGPGMRTPVEKGTDRPFWR
ncbi:hypothetical protein GGR52DRAFT_567923 [Hypoxylon sp. FL1284]|nr:hypothetical protein GGR52DRAFT_567923 [Hypoxylon sp. FL1284]